MNPIEADGAVIGSDWRENKDRTMRRRRGVVGLAYCLLCLLVAGASLVNVGLALPETREAWRFVTQGA